MPDAVLVLPPPPTPGSLADKEDLEVFRQTRALAGSGRWVLAARDATDYIGAFSCALGHPLSEAATPRTLHLLSRVGSDASVLTNRVKDHYGRPRPFLTVGLPICRPEQIKGLTKSASYPSGHATYSWAAGMVLADLVPDHAAAILARARAFGESRVVCGVHYVSDVEEGRTNGSLLFAVLQSDATFRSDLEAARSELALALQTKAELDPAECSVEKEASEHTPWINPTDVK